MSTMVGTKVTAREVVHIDKLVKIGIGLNRSDILRRALREFLEKHKAHLLETSEASVASEA